MASLYNPQPLTIIQHLSLSDNKIGHVAASALARGISTSRCITRLDLARCSIGDKGARVTCCVSSITPRVVLCICGRFF